MINERLFDHCVDRVTQARTSGDCELALQWARVAAGAAAGAGWFGPISAPRLESQLVEIASTRSAPSHPRPDNRRPRWLHVFTEAYATLGHTNLCRRWIQYDPDVTHDVILLAQRGAAPENLVAAAAATGGRCVVLDATEPLIERAWQLREYAWTHSDVVVLHTHPDEVMAVVAFGIPGGPVVLVMNHADHVFWLGCSVADAILEIRQSGLDWTQKLRGRPGGHILPIPLAANSAAGREEKSLRQERCALRQRLGIPEQALMLLTVGSASKYEPFENLNFVATAQQILSHQPDAYLVAVGPKQEGLWAEAHVATGGRMLAVGYQPDSTVFCRAADLYLEGFPLGSLTALLEAGQQGMMIVRAPLDSPLPFCSDSLSLATLSQPQDLDDYAETAVTLMRDEAARLAGGQQLQSDIEREHCGAGWLQRLREIRRQLPSQHRVHLDFKCQAAPAELRDWYLRYTHRNIATPTLAGCVRRVFLDAWKRTDATPEVTRELWATLSAATEGGTTTDATAPIDFTVLNHELAREGKCLRYLDRANTAWQTGRRWLALRSVYGCIAAVPSSIRRRDLWQWWLKVHLGRRLIRRLGAMASR